MGITKSQEGMMNKGLILDIAQFVVGGIAIYIYFQCSTILETVLACMRLISCP